MAVRARSSASVDLALGAVWLIDVCVTDADGYAADDTPVITITLPDGSTATPAVEDLGWGRYRAEYIPATAGRYVARAATLTHGAADFAAYITGVTAAGAMPVLADVLNYLGWTVDSDTNEAATALATELSAQRDVSRVPAVYPDSLRGALYRRVARNLALKGIPLAVLRGDSESGDTVLPGSDPEVRRLERPHRKLILG